MANMCDNHLEFICKSIPTWFKVDPETSHGISVEVDPHFLFLYNDFESIECNVDHDELDNQVITIEFWFETKWSPPEDLYASMIADENIISFNAVWYEPGCGCLGYANKDEGVQYEDAPDRNYSDFLGMDILKAEPPQCYNDIEGSDNWQTFDKYKLEMQEKLSTASTEEKIIIVDEVKELTEYFSDEESE